MGGLETCYVIMNTVLWDVRRGAMHKHSTPSWLESELRHFHWSRPAFLSRFSNDFTQDAEE